MVKDSKRSISRLPVQVELYKNVLDHSMRTTMPDKNSRPGRRMPTPCTMYHDDATMHVQHAGAGCAARLATMYLQQQNNVLSVYLAGVGNARRLRFSLSKKIEKDVQKDKKPCSMYVGLRQQPLYAHVRCTMYKKIARCTDERCTVIEDFLHSSSCLVRSTNVLEKKPAGHGRMPPMRLYDDVRLKRA